MRTSDSVTEPVNRCGNCAHWNRYAANGVKSSFGVCMVRRGEMLTFSPARNNCDVVAGNNLQWLALPWDGK